MWHLYIDEKYSLKFHLVAPELLDDLQAELASRFKVAAHSSAGGVTENPHFEVNFQTWYNINQPRLTLDLSGKQLRIDCKEVSEVIDRLTALKERKFPSGVAYYKLHGVRTCLVLSVSDYKRMLLDLQSQEDEAHKAADVFLVQAEKTWDRVKKKWKAEHGSDLPIGRKQDLLANQSKLKN